jgi:hypothetical protein
VLARTCQEDRIDLVLRGPRETVWHLGVGAEALVKPRNQALVEKTAILRRCHGHIAASLNVGDARIGGMTDVVFLGFGVIEKAQHGLFQERGGTRRSASLDLLFDRPLKLVGKLDRAHGSSCPDNTTLRVDRATADNPRKATATWLRAAAAHPML